jgi:hypothetical protein
MSKFLLTLSFAALLLTGASIRAHPISAQSQSGEQSKATKTVAGKVASIASDGHSFGLEVGQGTAKQTMQFVLDENAKIRGQVKVGTAVTVEYAVEGGQNTALAITAQA